MTVSLTQTMIRLRLPLAIWAVTRYAPGFSSGVRDGDAVIDVVGPRLQLQVPGGDLVAEVLVLLLLDEPVADVADVELLPVELAGVALEVGLDVVEQLGAP